MAPIPGEPHKPTPQELALGDGRKVKLKIPGMPPPIKPETTEERGAQEPPRDDPRPPVDPGAAGL